jgi:hypothetical protein
VAVTDAARHRCGANAARAPKRRPDSGARSTRGFQPKEPNTATARSFDNDPNLQYVILVLAREGRLRRRSEAERAGKAVPGRDRVSPFGGCCGEIPLRPDAAPAGAGLTWPRALGRFRGTARRALRPGREELADARGNSPPRSAARNRLNAAAGAPRGVRA